MKMKMLSARHLRACQETTETGRRAGGDSWKGTSQPPLLSLVANTMRDCGATFDFETNFAADKLNFFLFSGDNSPGVKPPERGQDLPVLPPRSVLLLHGSGIPVRRRFDGPHRRNGKTADGKEECIRRSVLHVGVVYCSLSVVHLAPLPCRPKEVEPHGIHNIPR